MGNEEGTFWIDEENSELVLKVGNKEESFIIEEELTIDENKYLILVPVDENDNEEALVFKLLKDEETLVVIEDDDEFERVREKYMSM